MSIFAASNARDSFLDVLISSSDVRAFSSFTIFLSYELPRVLLRAPIDFFLRVLSEISDGSVYFFILLLKNVEVFSLPYCFICYN